MIRIIIKKSPVNRLFDRMPLPNMRRSKVKVASMRRMEINGSKFIRKVSKISA
jgi:hypothetical protein